MREAPSTEDSPDHHDAWVKIRFPGEFQIGLRGMADLCGWRVKKDGPDGLPAICTLERYDAVPRPLARAIRLADRTSANDATAYERLRNWRPQDEYVDVPEIRQALARLGHPEGRTAWWATVRTLISAVTDEEFPGIVREAFMAASAQMPNASLWAFEWDGAVRWRLGAARALFAAVQTPEVLKRSEGEFRGFAAASSLMKSSSFAFDAYIDPMFLALSPWLLGIGAPRYAGSVVFLFGQAEAGLGGDADRDMTDLYRAAGPVTNEPRDLTQPRVAVEDAEELLRWWSLRVGELFALLLDPARFRDSAGVHDPTQHLTTLLGVERLFASCQTLLSLAHRDEANRLALMFDTIDLLDGLGFKSWDVLLSPKRVDRDLARLRVALPAAVGRLLLPRCERAAVALRAIGDGFLPERLEQGQLRVRGDDGAWRLRALDGAVAGYLRVMRNSHHSFHKLAVDPAGLSLLEAHEGDLSPDLADVAFLHLVQVLTNPKSVLRSGH